MDLGSAMRGEVYSKEVSGCLDGENLCMDWHHHQTVIRQACPRAGFVPTAVRYLAAKHGSNWFIGNILAVECDAKVTLNKKDKTRGNSTFLTYKWSSRPGAVWIEC